jgi:protein TonB
VAVIIKGNQPVDVAPFERKVPQMSMEIAPPPPPPPPVIKPKPLPRIVKVAPPPPSMPVVKSADTDEPSPDAVQVAVAPPPAPVVVKAPPPPPQERLLSADDFLVKPSVSYPPAAQKQRWQGRVTLKFHVLPSGQVDNVVIAKSSGYDILDDEAVKKIKAALLPPATRGNEATDALYTYSVNFKLS